MELIRSFSKSILKRGMVFGCFGIKLYCCLIKILLFASRIDAESPPPKVVVGERHPPHFLCSPTLTNAYDDGFGRIIP